MPKREGTVYVNVALPQHMHEALKRQAEAKDAPVSSLIRHAVEQWLKQEGEEVEDNVLWGGYRYPGAGQKDEPGR